MSQTEKAMSDALESPGSTDDRSVPPLTVLVVDDQSINRIVLKTMLAKDGHEVLLAENGAQAVEIYQREHPDMVLMDIMMPVMDGYEAAARIKEMAAPDFVPVIFLTAMTDEHALAQCIECGGDDFLTKPYSRIILRAKIDALARMRRLYDVVVAQRNELRLHHERLRQEHEIAERIFMNIAGGSGFDLPNVQYSLSPAAIANGDLVLAGCTPHGRQHVMLGDFTGHGLAAAIGALPVADVFSAMTSKGFGIAEIAGEINTKLHTKLPTGHFLAACLLEYDMAAGRVSVLNAGVPDVLLVPAGPGSVRSAGAENLPLGIVATDKMENNMQTFDVELGERLYLYSDGLIEAADPEGEMFGHERLMRAIDDNRSRGELFNEILAALQKFRRGESQADDITMVEVTCGGAAAERA
jgi:CheY-like chemotaxis protein